MFTELLNRLRGIRPEAPLPPLDARLASGALLVRIAKSDSEYVFEEIATIDRILARAHRLNAVEAAKLRATCEKLEAQAPDTETFTTMVQSAVPHEARVALVEALQRVALADQALKPEEEALLGEVAAAFGIAPEASAPSAREE